MGIGLLLASFWSCPEHRLETYTQQTSCNGGTSWLGFFARWAEYFNHMKHVLVEKVHASSSCLEAKICLEKTKH